MINDGGIISNDVSMLKIMMMKIKMMMKRRR